MEQAPSSKPLKIQSPSHKKQKGNEVCEDKFLVFCGCVVQTPVFGELVLDMNATIVVSSTTGVIERYFVEASQEACQFIETAKLNGQFYQLASHEFIMPGFIDCHIHAPQFSYTGTGLDLRM